MAFGIVGTLKFMVAFVALETVDLGVDGPMKGVPFSQHDMMTKFDQDYLQQLAFVDSREFTWKTVTTANNVHVSKRYDDTFAEYVHKFQVTCDASPEVLREAIGEVHAWTNWFRLVEEINILSRLGKETWVFYAKIIGVSDVLTTRGLLAGFIIRGDPDDSGAFLMYLSDTEWPTESDMMKHHVRLKTNIIAIRVKPLPNDLEGNEVADVHSTRSSVEFFFSADLGLPKFIPKTVVFRVFIPIIRKSILSLQSIVETRQKALE